MNKLEIPQFGKKKESSNRHIDQILNKTKEYIDCSKNAERELNNLNFKLEEGEKNKELIKCLSKLSDLLNKIEITMKDKLGGLFEESKRLIEENRLIVIENCSLSDIILNSPLMEASLMVRRGREAAVDSQKLPKLDQAIDRLDNSMKKINDYLEILCKDESILTDELSKRNGYLERFKGYFKDNPKKDEAGKNEDKLYPTGAKKIDFFITFYDVVQGKMDEEEFIRSRQRLPEGYLKESL